MFEKVLIANRGEIALRIIRALREMSIRSVAVYSAADKDALHVKFADEAVCIGPANATLSYLHIPSIISAAEITRADAVHPGYGFLAENAEFAEICRKCNLKWIGPSPEVISLMGDKVRARKAMEKAGVPVLPGTGVLGSEKELLEAAKRIGYPVILKATAGGGGKGMKIATNKHELINGFNTGRREAAAAFGCPDMYMERYCQRPRHIEVQVVGDSGGNAAHLGERECSMQRRHQKILEECPSAGLPEATRKKLLAAAVKATKKIGYVTVGTLEFLLDENDEFYFMEMNTRLQVEHPITEEVTGVDLVREQIRLAAGAALSFKERKPRGHAIEMRINAEHPETFLPCAGRVTGLNIPGGLGVRVDTHLYEGYVVPPNYDSLIAKLIVHDDNREQAIGRARRCLDEFVVEGIFTNLDFHKRLVRHPDFLSANYDTGFVGRLVSSNER